MDTKICRQCGGAFAPRRSTQKYCSATCSRRHRDRAWRERNGSRSPLRHGAQLAEAAAEARINLESVTFDFKRKLAEEKLELRNQLALQASEHEQETEKLRTRLRELATINVDIACEVPELKAQVSELQLENARILHSWRGDNQELTQVACRLFELSARLGIPLDRTTREIFQRHSWRTNTLISDK